MKMKGWHVICFSFFSLIMFQAAQAAAPTPIGSWQTIDDVTGKPKAIVSISLLPDQTLVGRIEKVFSNEAVTQHSLCTACTGDKHNQPIVGMDILWGLKLNNAKRGEWVGEILDPNNGKTYHSIIRIVENDKKLNVRGYIGIPLFGRSQTWLRMS